MNAPTTCVCVVTGALEDAMLLREVDALGECPRVELPAQRLDFFPDHVPHIVREVAAATGLDVVALRQLPEWDGVKMCLLEARTDGPLPNGYTWLSPRESEEPHWSDEPSRAAWEAWRGLVKAGFDSPALAPWERRGWFAQAAAWIEARLLETGHSPRGPVEQVKGAWDWSAILSVPTDRGRLYLKADYARPPSEVEVVLKLAERWPRNVPKIVASDVERGWMLMSDFGGTPTERLSEDRARDALRLYAGIQRWSADHIDEWRRLGLLDMTATGLSTAAERLCADVDVLRGGENGLDAEESAEFRSRLPQALVMLERLASSALPTSISNEDFRAGNVLARDEGCLLFDWSGTVLSHPLLGVNYFLNRIVRGPSDDGFRWRNELYDDERIRLADAFLKEWTDRATMDALWEEFWLCRRLSFLYEALRGYADLPFVSPDSPWGAGTRTHVPQALRGFLRTLRSIE